MHERQNKRYELLQQKQRLQQQLEQIERNVAKIDMYIDDANRDIRRITSEYESKDNELENTSTNYQFEIVACQQQSDCYNKLLNIVNDSFTKLKSWSANRSEREDKEKDDIEDKYVNNLATYLQSLCIAKSELINRVQHLKDGIEQFKQATEISNQQYGKNRNTDNQLKDHKRDIKIDETTNKNIEKDIYIHIDRAQKIVATSFFNNFINHLDKTNVGQMIDLSKYHKPQPQKNQPQPQPPRSMSSRPPRPTRQSAATQTQLNGRAHMNNMNNFNMNNINRNQVNVRGPRKRPIPSSQSQTRMGMQPNIGIVVTVLLAVVQNLR